MIYDTQNLISAVAIAEGELEQQKKDLSAHATEIIKYLKTADETGATHNRLDDLEHIIQHLAGDYVA